MTDTSKGALKSVLQKLYFPLCIISALAIVWIYVWYLIHIQTKKARKVYKCNTITILSLGELGNQVYEYLSLYVTFQLNKHALQEYSVTPYIEESMKDDLYQLFVDLPLNRRVNNKCLEKNREIMIYGTQNLSIREEQSVRYRLGNYSYRYKDFIRYGMRNIRKDIRFRPDLSNNVTTTLTSIRSHYNTPTFVCMHYRGGDYLLHLLRFFEFNYKGPPNSKYYITAMNYFKTKYKEVVFILVTKETGWLSSNVDEIAKNGHVVVNPYNMTDKFMDFVLLSSCNHSIINYGSFGSTSALFAGGDTIAYAFLKKEDPDILDSQQGKSAVLGIAKYISDARPPDIGTWYVGNETYVGLYDDFY